MNATQLIEKIEALKARHGDLPVMLKAERGENVYEVGSVTVQTAYDGQYPKDWNMPEGFKFIQITD